MINKDLHNLAEILSNAGFRITNFNLELNDETIEDPLEIYELKIIKIPETIILEKNASADEEAQPEQLAILKNIVNSDKTLNILNKEITPSSYPFSLKHLTNEKVEISATADELKVLSKAQRLLTEMKNKRTIDPEKQNLNINISFFTGTAKAETHKASQEEADLLNEAAFIIKRKKEANNR